MDIKVRNCWDHLLKARYATVPAVAATANAEVYSSTRDILQAQSLSFNAIESEETIISNTLTVIFSSEFRKKKNRTATEKSKEEVEKGIVQCGLQ